MTVEAGDLARPYPARARGRASQLRDSTGLTPDFADRDGIATTVATPAILSHAARPPLPAQPRGVPRSALAPALTTAERVGRADRGRQIQLLNHIRIRQDASVICHP